MAAEITRKDAARPLRDALSAVSQAAAALAVYLRRPSPPALEKLRTARDLAARRLKSAERPPGRSSDAMSAACRELGRAMTRLGAAGEESAVLGAEPDVFVREIARALEEGLAGMSAALERPAPERAAFLLRARARLERCGDLNRDGASHTARAATVAEGMKLRAVYRNLLDAAERSSAAADRLLDDLQGEKLP